MHNRVARLGDKVYVDLANPEHEVVEITPTGWQVVTDPPIKFVCGPHAGPLPRPERGGSIADLRPFVNLPDDHFRMYAAGLLDALKGHGEYLVVVATGEQGSGKATISRVAARLLDPRRLLGPHDLSDIPGPPKSEDDLAVAAVSHHLLAFDNVSRITDEMSDAFCRVATGGGVTKRRLYSDGDLVRLSYCGPLWLNAIPDIVNKGDLADRAVFLRADPLATRKPAAECWAAFAAARPRILGVLYDAVAAGLAGAAAGPLPAHVRLPRMAASGTWIYHCFAQFGWSYADWCADVAAGQEVVTAAALDDSPLGQAVLAWSAVLGGQGPRPLPGDPDQPGPAGPGRTR